MSNILEGCSRSGLPSLLFFAAFFLLGKSSQQASAQNVEFILDHSTQQEFLLWPMVGADVTLANKTTSLEGVFHTQFVDASDLKLWLATLHVEQEIVPERFSIKPGGIYGKLPDIGSIYLLQNTFIYYLKDPALRPQFEVMVGYLWFSEPVKEAIEVPDNLKLMTTFKIIPSLGKHLDLIFSETLLWRSDRSWYSENRVLGGISYLCKEGMFTLAYQGRWRKGISFVEDEVKPDRWTHSLIARLMINVDLGKKKQG